MAGLPMKRGPCVAGAAAAGAWLDPAAGAVTTQFVGLPGLLSGRRVERADGRFSWPELTVHESPGPRANAIPGDMGPPWGLHLIDMNVMMRDLQHLFADQGAAWSAAHPAIPPDGADGGRRDLRVPAPPECPLTEPGSRPATRAGVHPVPDVRGVPLSGRCVPPQGARRPARSASCVE
jgi:hypothetical protein